MSILFRGEDVYIISHETYAEQIYRNTHHQSKWVDFLFNEDLFKITNQYIRDAEIKSADVNFQKSRKRKKLCHAINQDSSGVEKTHQIKQKFLDVMGINDVIKIFSTSIKCDNINNYAARNVSKLHFENLPKNSDIKYGKNYNNYPISIINDNTNYLIPPRCHFYNCDVINLTNVIRDEVQFDFILLDPPWWNKYIRRKRKKNEQEGYQMMYNSEVASIPLQQLLAKNGLVAVWCTNSPSHIKSLIDDIFPSWNLKHISTWFWIKVTKSGLPVCDFSVPPGKQPFERILFACHSERNNLYKSPEDNKIIISVPSAIHSHKPPLVDVISEYLCDEPKCLELFARYLLPGWRSCGNQVLSLQNLKLYCTVNSEANNEQI